MMFKWWVEKHYFPFTFLDSDEFHKILITHLLQVLDEEAEVFVVKMWRLLIYEIEAKKLGLVK